MNPAAWLPIIFLVGIVALLGGAVAWDSRRKKREELQAREEAADFVEPPASEATTPATKPATKGAREQRAQEIRERTARGVCVYCDCDATRRGPRPELRRSVLDRLYRYLNVVPMNRWSINVDSTPRDKKRLCQPHDTIARSHWERWLAEDSVDLARFVERQQHDLYEFDRYGLDERMRDDATAILQRPKSKRASKADAATGARGSLTVVKNDTARNGAAS